MQRIGVFICWCGSNIAATVDVEKLSEMLGQEPGVVYAANYRYMCSENGQALIKKGENNHLEISYKDETVMELSLVSLILIFLLCWWLPAILIVVGLFTGYKFRVTGSGAAGRIVNTVSEKASQKADEIVNKMNEEKEEE